MWLASHLRNPACIAVNLLCLWPDRVVRTTSRPRREGPVLTHQKESPAHAAGPLELAVLLTSRYQRVDASSSAQFLDPPAPVAKPHPSDHSSLATGWSASRIDQPSETSSRSLVNPDLQPSPQTHPQEVDPLYLFGCHLAWEHEEEPCAAWELLAAAQSSHADTRAHARALLASSRPHQWPGCRGPLHHKTKAACRDGDRHECTLWPRYHRRLRRVHQP